jgi:hypothetical protein
MLRHPDPPPVDLPPTTTPVEAERAALDALSGVEKNPHSPADGRGLIAVGVVALVLALVAVLAVAPLGPLFLPVLVAALGGGVVGAAVVARRQAGARAEFAELRRQARAEAPVRPRAEAPVRPRRRRAG